MIRSCIDIKYIGVVGIYNTEKFMQLNNVTRKITTECNIARLVPSKKLNA